MQKFTANTEELAHNKLLLSINIQINVQFNIMQHYIIKNNNKATHCKNISYVKR